MMLVDILLLVDTFNACQHYPYETRKEMKWKPEYILSFYFYYISLLIPENKLYPKWNTTHTHNIGTKTDRQSCFWSVRFQLYFFNVYASVKYPRTIVKKVWYTCIRWWWWLLLTSTFFSRFFQFCFFFEFLNWHWHKTVFWNVTNITLNFVWIHSVTIDDDKQDKLRYFFLSFFFFSCQSNQ